MPTTITGNAASFNTGITVATTGPAAGEAPAAAQVNTPAQKAVDGLEHYRTYGARINKANTFANLQTFEAGIAAGTGVDLDVDVDLGQTIRLNAQTYITGGAQVEGGDFTLRGPSTGVYVRNDPTLDYGSGAVSEVEYYGNSKLFGQLYQASATTTDAATTINAITYPIANGQVIQIVTTLTATQSDFSAAVMAMTADAFRRTGGVTTGVDSKTLYTATDEIGVASYGWNLSGANLIYQIQGKAATTIRWNIKAEISVIG